MEKQRDKMAKRAARKLMPKETGDPDPDPDQLDGLEGVDGELDGDGVEAAESEHDGPHGAGPANGVNG
jgi:hypothetical protein